MSGACARLPKKRLRGTERGPSEAKGMKGRGENGDGSRGKGSVDAGLWKSGEEFGFLFKGDERSSIGFKQ